MRWRRSSRRSAPTDARAAVGALVSAWIGRLSGGASKHDVNHLLAPLILMERLLAPRPSHLGKTRFFNMRGGSVSSPRPSRMRSGRCAEPRREPWIDASGIARSSDRRFAYLVDDQAEHGRRCWPRRSASTATVGSIEAGRADQ